MARSRTALAALAALVASCAPHGAVRDNGAGARQLAAYPMVELPAGRFSMGSGATLDEAPHEVRITRPYLLGAQEVTQRLWRDVMGDRPVASREMRIAGTDSGPCVRDHGVDFAGEDLPVVCVDWLDAVRFANAMSAREGLAPAYQIDREIVRWDRDANGYRLPTEAEWEWAARLHEPPPPVAGACPAENLADASADRVWRWGHEPCDDTFPGLAPVGSFPPSPAGLYDLGGNAAEWCWDAYLPYEAAAARDPAPEGPTDRPSGHVTRGPSFRTPSRTARLSARGFGMGHLVTHAVGLRLARTAP